MQPRHARRSLTQNGTYRWSMVAMTNPRHIKLTFVHDNLLLWTSKRNSTPSLPTLNWMARSVLASVIANSTVRCASWVACVCGTVTLSSQSSSERMHASDRPRRVRGRATSNLAFLIDGKESRRDTGDALNGFAQNASAGMSCHFNIWPRNQNGT